MEKLIVSMEMADRNKEIKDPMFDVGSPVLLTNKKKDGTLEDIPGMIISNNTIDYVTLEAVYDIEIDKTDIDGNCIVLKNVPESIFEKDININDEEIKRNRKRNEGRAHR